jgi:multisubunit Na+/H+ antiporter MnhE subunit
MVEVLVWWVVLAGLWVVSVSTVDPAEIVVGVVVALVGAVAARGARRAGRER